METQLRTQADGLMAASAAYDRGDLSHADLNTVEAAFSDAYSAAVAAVGHETVDALVGDVLAAYGA
jgi:hypothetical protein